MEATLTAQRYVEILGADRLISTPEALGAYAADMTENPEGRPDLVVKPRSVEEVQAVVRQAAADGTPLVPAVARMNVGGLTIAADGGIVVDLSDMNRIVELDREHMHVVIEPGVSFEQLKAHLDEHAPDLTISYPLAPPYVSVMANLLMDGLGSLSPLHGAAGENIGALEAVLPDGTLVRTGSAAVSPVWFARAPLPDLTGLFVGFQGTTGIVTKIAAQLWRQPPLGKRLFVFCDDLPRTFELMRDLARSEVCRDISAFTWPVAKMALGVPRPMYQEPSEPEAVLYFDFAADDEEGLAYKERTARRHIRETVASIDELVAVAPALKRFAEFPVTLDFMLDYPGGGLTWVGTYGPTSRWEEGAARCRDLMLERGFPPTMVTRPMKGGHYGVLRPICCFDRGDDDEVRRVRELNLELLELLVDLGYIPYKAPDWAVRELAKRAHPGFVDLLERVRSALDPQGIMNPSRLPFSTSSPHSG